MIGTVVFQIGNIVADASIAIFAFTLYLSEVQRNRTNRLLSLLSISSIISDSQAVIIGALVDMRDRKTLESYLKTNTQVKAGEQVKLTIIQRNLRWLHSCNIVILVAFAGGIAIEVIGVALT